MSSRWNHPAVAVLAILFPIAAFADLSGTVTVNANQSLNLETGAAAASGGDLLWTGTTLVPQGSTVAANISNLSAVYTGASGYAMVNQLLLQAGLQAGLGSKNPLSSLAVGIVIGAQDNSGNYAKLLVTAVSSASISLQFLTYGASSSGGGSGGPTITMIQNNYSYLVPGLPNYGIAPGTLFIVKGSSLASATTVSSLQSSVAPGIPLSLNGASISVTVNGVTTHPAIYYAIAGQIAAVLPSGTPVGTGTLTVTYNGVASAPATITVVQSALGLDTYYGTGSGLGVATDLNYNVFNYTNSAKPSQNIILWGSGLGADAADSDTTYTTTPHSVNVPLTVYVGGIAVTPSYAGSAGFPGLNQINLTIPAAVQPGCGVSVVAVSGNIVSNTVTLPISASGGTCSDPALGSSGTTISTIGGKSNFNFGEVAILQSTSSGKVTNAADAIFENEQTTSSATVSGLTSLGSCVVSTSIVGPTTLPTITGLDAGTITVTGPTGTQTLTSIPQALGTSFVSLPAGFIPATGGSYTFNGAGGANVGAFSVSIAYTSPLTWTNSSITSVVRANGQTINWAGGAAGSYVYIVGSSSSSTASASFTCYAPASAGIFTVPSYVLLALPPGSGSLAVENVTTPVSFSASGLDYGLAIAGVSFSITPSYQ